MVKKELYELNKGELIEKVKGLQQEKSITQDAFNSFKDQTKDSEETRMYLGNSNISRVLKKNIKRKFAIQALISIGLLVGSLCMVQNGNETLLPGMLLFIFGLIYYNQIMVNHTINMFGASELIIQKRK